MVVKFLCRKLFFVWTQGGSGDIGSNYQSVDLFKWSFFSFPVFVEVWYSVIGRSDGHMLLSIDSYGISTTRRSSRVTLVILSVLVVETLEKDSLEGLKA